MSETMKKILNLLERAGTTFAEQFLTVLLSTGAASLLISPDWASAADRAAFAGLVSIGTSLLTFGLPKLPAGVDALLRVGKTGLQVFLGDLIASSATPSVVHADWKHALAAGITVMGPAALKVIGAMGISSTVGASLLPASVDHGTISPEDLEYVSPDLLDYSPAGAHELGREAAVNMPDEPIDMETVTLPYHVEANLSGTGTGDHAAQD